MENWEENVMGRTSFGLVRLAEEAICLCVWEYAVLAIAIAAVWLYRVLDFHFVGDFLRGFRGEVPMLHYNSASKVAEEILPKCTILKQRYSATPWLSNPHFQTAFLHFNGRPPPIKYHRELFITPDKGTIALDWVISPLDENESSQYNGNPELDDTPVVIIIPGLTSDSNDKYLKHIAYCSSMRGWRTLVVNHRGLGGVSITSEQFYNAGWTEDLRSIVNHIHEQYRRASLFTIGTSIGANILVKYLGEEGASTPVGAAAAVCCPWDLLVCNRFLLREGIQKLYNRVLAFGLVQYLSLHQIVLGRLADWKEVSKSKSIYAVDHFFTRHTGKYETVDTYYRRTCSADFLAKVAVPLLCFNALDDPICTKEAIPWDEVKANPNVILVVTKHGGHLAYFEGLTARTIWWARALTDYMTAIMPSDLMHTPQRVSSSIMSSTAESDVDEAPYLSVSSDGQVAAEDLQPSSPMGTDAEDPVHERDVNIESTFGAQEEDALASRDTERSHLSVDDGEVTVTFRKRSELTALQSALSQLLEQLQKTRPARMECRSEHLVRAQNGDDHTTEPEPTAAEALVGQLKQSAVSALQESSLQTLEVPVSASVVSTFRSCREAATHLASASTNQHDSTVKNSNSSSTGWRKSLNQSNEKESTSQVIETRILQTAEKNSKGFALIAAQNRKTLWLLTYIALVTTCPLIGSALFMHWHGKVVKFTNRLLK